MPLAPMSLASTIIGFISFFLTILTWTNVFWESFFQLIAAPLQVVDNLSTLRQRLFEERTHVRRRRKVAWALDGGKHEGRYGVYWDGGPAKIMNDALKDLITDFKNLGRPFLTSPHEGLEKDLEWSYDATQHYYHCDLWHRIKWIQSRKGIIDVERRLNAFQIRRTAIETSENQTMLLGIMGMMKSEDRIAVTE